MKTTLYKLNNNNQISWWTIEQDGCDYYISWGQDLNTLSRASKNTNKYSCLIPEQATQKVQSRIDHQRDRKGYTSYIPKSPPNLPMLAQDWSDHLTRDPFPSVAIQPKIDGQRCLATNKGLTSKRDLPIKSCPHIELIMELVSSLKFDGELYIPNTDLETIESYVKRNYPHKLHKVIEYHVFDIVDTNLNFYERYKKLQQEIEKIYYEWKEMSEIYNSVPAKLRPKGTFPEIFPIKLVPTHFIDLPSQNFVVKEEIKGLFTEYTSKGYEGCMVRNPESPYTLNYRSPDLLKYKERKDNEFEIVGVEEVADRLGGLAQFICKTKEGKIFECTPSWTKDARRSAWKRKDYYIGRWLTVEYERISADGKPLKPTGKLTHEEEEKE